jgi:hypothetical protein
MAASMEAGFKEGTDQLKAVYDATLALGVPERRLRIDLGIARVLIITQELSTKQISWLLLI